MDEDQVPGQEVDEGEEIEHEAGQNGIADRLKALENAQANNQARAALQQLVSDPDVAALIQAKRAGKAVKVVEDEPETGVENEPDPAEGLDEDDPQRKLITTLNSLFETKLSKMKAEIDERLGEVQSVAEHVQRKEVSEQVANARQKYKDFDQFKDKMLELSKQIPGLNVDDYYILAKNRSGKLRQVESVASTEKPTELPRRSPAKPGAKPPQRAKGRKGFDQILADVMGRIEFEGVDAL